jgi:predicted 3-demethylubiquinone-9 3-methyltransferase (glyoxalase superfamily)
MKPITPCLWFDEQAHDAAKFYVSIFGDSRISKVTHYFEGGPRPAGMVMTVDFELNGQPFLALNGGPNFKFNPAISLVVQCRTQAQIDKFWDRLSAGGEKGVCGWLTDKFGVSWQVVPADLQQWLDDSPGSTRFMQAVMTMKKLDIAALKKAYKG